MSGVAIAPTSVEGTNGSTIRSIAAVHLTVTVVLQTSLAAPPAETLWLTDRRAHASKSDGKAEISAAHAIAPAAIAEGSATDPALAGLAIARAVEAVTERAALVSVTVRVAGVAPARAELVSVIARAVEPVIARVALATVPEVVARAALATATCHAARGAGIEAASAEVQAASAGTVLAQAAAVAPPALEAHEAAAAALPEAVVAEAAVVAEVAVVAEAAVAGGNV